MGYLPVLNLETANPEAKQILSNLKAKLGFVPNIYAAMANSPKALSALLSFGSAMSGGALNKKESEAIALAVGQDNSCDYCIAAHTAIAKGAGFSAEEAKDLRQAKSSDDKLDALAKLAKEISATRGHPSEGVLKKFYAVGYNDAALAEVIASVAHNLFTNYFNHIAATEIDFPPAD